MDMLEAKSTLVERRVKAKGHDYTQYIIYIPKDIVKDSQFKLKAKDILTIRLETPTRLIIEKA
ncbi:hypothetical protein MUP77_09420 [Candidatus Bathyarchaeota archaeon]|nr:hypothetical protein [Candidatus Bathyarchaeota archaeon]